MEEEFDRVYRETAKELFWIAYALIKDKEIADNAVQEAFMAVWEDRERLLGSPYLYGYLVRSVKNYVSNYRRDELNRAKHESEIAYLTSQDSEVDEDEYAARLKLARKLVAELPERCREAFVKCVLEGMSYQDCAGELDVSVNTVKFHVKEAYERLRKGAKNDPKILLLVVCCLYFIDSEGVLYF